MLTKSPPLKKEHVPTQLRKALGDALVKEKWDNLTPIARRDFITWINSAKQSETRTRRIERTCDMIAKGKRRPCCYAVVPMNLYKALGTHAKAKSQWKTLTPTQRRDFIDWIDSTQNSEERTHRIKKTCNLLEAGKRNP